MPTRATYSFASMLVFHVRPSNPPGPRAERAARRDIVERAEVEIEELGLGGPVLGERPFEAAADGPTDALLAIGAEVLRNAGCRENRRRLGGGVERAKRQAARCVDQHAVPPRGAEANASGREPIELLGGPLVRDGKKVKPPAVDRADTRRSCLRSGRSSWRPIRRRARTSPTDIDSRTGRQRFRPSHRRCTNE